MNDYAKGAFEALAWVQGLMGNLKGWEKWQEYLKRELD